MRINGECDRRLFWGIVSLWGLVCSFFSLLFVDFLFWRVQLVLGLLTEEFFFLHV